MVDESDEGKPLHFRVAEALGWMHIGPGNSMNLADPGIGYPPITPMVGHKEPVPRYDIDWSATGPLIERFGFTIERSDEWETDLEKAWSAALEVGTEKTTTGVVEVFSKSSVGPTPLIAVCTLIVALAKRGLLPTLPRAS
jgi:hypothetical protein